MATTTTPDTTAGTSRLATYRLEDRYDADAGRVYLSGSQALVRLPMMQRQRDREAGLNTAGFISGYTGSPLGMYDFALKRAQSHLKDNDIRFQPGVNEDLAAAAVWGSQQVAQVGPTDYDGVFAMWYGKGPGVDRSGDALKHGSYAGAAPLGGVLVLAGDDHGAKSSTTAHQSDHAFIHFGMPYFNPANVQELLDYGLYGFALSRHSGCWVGIKCITDTVESSGSVDIDPGRIRITLPELEPALPKGLNLRWGVYPREAEVRQYRFRIPAVQAFVRANGLDRTIIAAPERKLGIVTSGKAFLDLMQALEDLGLDDTSLAALGVSIYKVAMPWPLEPFGIRAFCLGNREILVVEEKRAVVEDQLAKLLINEPERPRLYGKQDELDQPLIPADGELNARELALLIGPRLQALGNAAGLADRLAHMQGKRAAAAGASLIRLPSFCSGCPHNTSTRVPDGSLAFGGIGCHGMAMFLPERKTPTLFQMGGEGAPWIGIAPFSKTRHIFQNLGDGTYFHSGILAIRAVVASGVNLTYKILVNDAIAMTGGQSIEGQVQVDTLAWQVRSEGVQRIAVVSDDIRKYDGIAKFPEGVEVHHRSELDAVQRAFREVPGVSAIIYDQACATELRRKRKRGKAPDPDFRIFINPEVCEGCGDCSVQSNCIAIEPHETELGRKRRINQSSCNKDQSCLNGYCPSFVKLHGAKLKSANASATARRLPAPQERDRLPSPALLDTTDPYSVLITGIGGLGVVTVGALVGMAAHLDGKACSVLDVTGLAQRNGAVTSHVRFCDSPERMHATRIARSDLVVGCDIVVSSGAETLQTCSLETSRGVINTHVAPTSAFAQNPDLNLSPEKMEETIGRAIAPERLTFIDATRLAYLLLGDEVLANLFLLGLAYQKGWLPLSLQAIERAVELNGVAVEENMASFQWGRLAAADPDRVWAEVDATDLAAHDVALPTLGETVADRKRRLTAYQDERYAQRFQSLLDRVMANGSAPWRQGRALEEAVARNYYKLLAYKDEYEVARLHASPEFAKRLREEFEGDFTIEFNMAPPLLQRRNARTGRYPKQRFGPWFLTVLRVLAKFRFLRGTWLDVFGYSQHRRMERRLITEYEATVNRLLDGLDERNYTLAVEIASIPESIRGYDVVKEASVEVARKRQAQLFDEFERLRDAA